MNPQPADTSQDRRRILVVDDYQPTRRLIAEALDERCKYEVIEAENGREALELFNKYPFDLVISDIMMPGLSGIDLLSALLEKDPGVAVMMITAHTAPEMTVTAMKRGAVDFIHKPFDIDELIFKVNIYLKNKTKDDPPARAVSPRYNTLIHEIKSELSLHQYVYEEIEKESGSNDAIFNKMVELALKIVRAGAAYIFLYHQEEDDLTLAAVKSANGLEVTTIPPGWSELFKGILKEEKGVIINSEDHHLVSHSMICAPLAIRSKLFGLLVVEKDKKGGIFSVNDLNLILSLTKRASLNLENKILYESIYDNLIATFDSLIASIEARDHYTRSHSQRIARMAVKLARVMNCSEDECESLRIAATLHDIGKISIPDNILMKAGRLTQEEYLVMKNHPLIGESILQSVSLLSREKKIVRHHHERWDGNGYPDRIGGQDIPSLARILAVVDSYDAMTSNRPYRRALSQETAIAELIKGKDSQFQGEIVDCFIQKVLSKR